MKSDLGYGALRHASKVLSLLSVALLMQIAPARAETPTLVAFGDSLTQGYGLPEADGFVPQLRDWLDREGIAAEVINAGVSGDTTAGGAARIAWTLTPEVDAIIVTLGGNDVLRGIAPETSRANMEQIVKTATEAGLKVLIVGMTAPNNYGPEYKAAFDAIYPDLAAAYGTGYAETFFLGLAPEDGGPINPAQVQQFMQGDGIHPNAEGVKKIVAALGPYVADMLSTQGGDS